ncbi:phage head protein [Pasteurellaceae bacterium LFhippo2]|nr:phage head protein [Pasteurellaceae bacterium LFhippo2]
MNHVISIPKVDNKGNSDPPNNEKASWITNNGFFPDLNLLDVRNAMRVDGTVTDERLKIAVIEAMASTNDQLKPLQNKYHSLEDIQADEINGESIVELRYKRAVYCLAMANLYERYRSYDSTKEGAEKAEQFENSVDDLRRDARFAIRDLLNIKRWTVELI